MSLPDPELLELLKNDFVVGWENIDDKEHVGVSHGYSCKQTAIGTTNGAGGRNVQIIVMASDTTVLHVLPGFWHPEDLAKELLYARQLFHLHKDKSKKLAEKRRFASMMRGSHLRSMSEETIARSDWQGFDGHTEFRRYKNEPRDTIVLSSAGKPQLKPVCQVVHDRMSELVFTKLAKFDLEEFVDYGRAFYDNNSRIGDKGKEFRAAKKANRKRERREAKEQRERERNSK